MLLKLFSSILYSAVKSNFDYISDVGLRYFLELCSRTNALEFWKASGLIICVASANLRLLLKVEAVYIPLFLVRD